MGHPHTLGIRQTSEQGTGLGDLKYRATEFAQPRLINFAAHRLRHRLEAVADPEDRYPKFQDRFIKMRCTNFIDTRRPPAEHDRRWISGRQLRRRDGVRDDLRVDICLAHPAGDELRVLRTKIND